MILDTHTVFWLAESPDELSPAALTAIRNEREQGHPLGISDQTLWELAMMVHRGRVQVSTSIRDFLEAVERQFVVYPLSPAIAERAQYFSDRFPRDPRDRIIAATAILHGGILVTKDEKVRRSGEVSCIW